MGTKGRVWVTIGTYTSDAKSLTDFKSATVPSSSGLKGSYLLSIQTPQVCRSSSFIWTLSMEPRHLHF